MEGHIVNRIAEFSWPIVLTLTGVGLTLLGMAITLIASGALGGAA